jgi:hypothetical protein
VIADVEVTYPLANLLDDACCFVAEYDREGRGVEPIDRVEVGMADAARREAHLHLALTRRVESNLLDDERPAELVQDGGFDRILGRSSHPGILARRDVSAVPPAVSDLRGTAASVILMPAVPQS